MNATYFGYSLRTWLLLAMTMVASLSTYSYVMDVHDQITTLHESRSSLENAVSKLEAENREISRRSLEQFQQLKQMPPVQQIVQQLPGEGVLPPSEDQVIVYNRVPKTGSTTFAGVAYELCQRNNFHVVHMDIVYPNKLKVLGLQDQKRFVDNLTDWEAVKPAIYHGHVSFIDFTRFSIKKKPIYINMVREPVDRLVSYYYFQRNGDDFDNKVHLKAGDNETFDQCVARDGDDCNPVNLWVQIPYFCGHHADCWNPGNAWALAEAKRNVLHHYLLVGVTERLGDFVAALEAALPRFFTGGTQYFKENDHLRTTANKVLPSEVTREKIRKSSVWKMENEFYEFVLDHFMFFRNQTFTEHENGELTLRETRLAYGKIQPRLKKYKRN